MKSQAQISSAIIVIVALVISASVIFAPGSSLTAQTQKAKPGAEAKSASQSGDVQLYRNLSFGFRYRIPYAWVDRTKEMQEGNDSGKAEVLLAVFEHPPEVTANSVNSAVVISSESAASYPGLKRAEDYIEPLTELATAKGFKADGEPSVVEIDDRQLARADFTKPLSDKLTMHQCALALLAKGRIVSFIFVGGSEDEIEDLMDELHFGSGKAIVH